MSDFFGSMLKGIQPIMGAVEFRKMKHLFLLQSKVKSEN